jgi:hypothetical protein
MKKPGNLKRSKSLEIVFKTAAIIRVEISLYIAVVKKKTVDARSCTMVSQAVGKNCKAVPVIK